MKKGNFITQTIVGMAIGFLLAMAPGAWAQDADAAPPPAPSAALLSPADLQQLLQPVALYPDPLLAELLPAATLPSQIVVADRWISEGNNPNDIAQQPWDPAVQAIAHYPQLLKWMDDNLAWTTQVGQAFLNQQQDVMDAIQALRAKAQELGNLPSTPQETVQQDDGEIDIEPTNPDEMYLPVYQPDLIFYEPGIYCTFGVGWPIGGWMVYDWDWRRHHIVTWGLGHPRPVGWWHLPPAQRFGQLGHAGTPVWRQGSHVVVTASRPADRGWPGIDIRGTARPAHVFRPAAPAPPIRPAQPPSSFRASPPLEQRQESGVGMFGGPQNSLEARQSSARGMESRGVAPAPARSFSAPHAGGGGGGGGHR